MYKQDKRQNYDQRRISFFYHMLNESMIVLPVL